MRSPLLEQFLTEGRELIDEAAESLLALEQTPDDEGVVNQIFRSVHTLKGNSGLFEYPALTGLLHAGEELMVAVRERTVALSPEMMDVLLEMADHIRKFLDEIDNTETIESASVEEGQRLATALNAFLELSEQVSAAVDDELGALGTGGNGRVVLPEWADELLTSDVLEPGPDGPVTLFEYRPAESCFFRGEDPLATVAQVEEVRWRSVSLDSNIENLDDPFVCAVVIRGVSAASRASIEYSLRYVEEDVTFWCGPSSASALSKDLESAGPTGAKVLRLDAMSDDEKTAHDLVLKQISVLTAAGEIAAPSVCKVLHRAFSFLQDETALSALRDLGGDIEVEPVFAVIEAYERRLRAASREVEAAKEKPKTPAETPKKDASAGGDAQQKSPRVLRVDQVKVDRLMNLIGQLVVAKNGLPYIARRLETHGDAKVASRELKEHSAVVDRISRELQAAIMEVRMLPVSQVFQRFPRLVRDVSRKFSKQIELYVVGEETQADKNVIEALSEPLVHLVRNSLDHGIESPQEREEQGKPQAGYIRLSARNENETVVITIEDDGRGIDPSKIRQLAVKRGLHTEESVARLSDDEARMLIFAPGFSTKEQASELSGRGVGMDVVRTTIEKAGGRVSLQSEVGVGTSITLSLPLSMAVSHVMTVIADEQLYGIGMDTVVETVRCRSDKIQVIKGREAFVLREELIPILRLRRLLNLPEQSFQNTYGEEAVLVLRCGGESIGLVVDEFGENIEVLVRPLEGWISQMTEYSGSAVLGDGRLLLVLDMKELIRDGS